jgi:uncharacterized protein (DUF1800 family)
MAGQAKALHVLDRMAFGPRPGDVEEVEAMGVNRWLDLQLHPEKISDDALKQRMADYNAPFMDPQTLILKFPSGNLIRQALKGRASIPSEQPDQAVWKSQMAITQQRQERKNEQSTQPTQQNNAKDAGQSGAGQAAMLAGAENGTAGTPAPDERRQKLRGDVDVSGVLNLSADQRYEALLAMQPGDIQEFVRSLAPAERPGVIAGMSPTQRETVLALLNPRLVVVNETESVRLLQDIYSERQLQRVMTEFWLNHFNIYTGKNEREPYYLPQFEHEVVAPHALGKFEDLLDAVATSPAMLLYLDNEQSVGPNSPFALRREHAPVESPGQMGSPASAANALLPVRAKKQSAPGINENYGRELMELHTVGVNAGYTQQDVIEAAKVFTGWTVAPPQQGGGFRFDERRHEPGPKVVIGHTIQEGGEQEGLELLHILATSPATAHFISQELAVRFVSDNPSTALVNRMAKTFLSSDGDMGKVLRTMIHSPEFWSAPDHENKIKTPLDYVVSAARVTNADVTQPYRLVAELKVMGMPLSGTEEPNGYAMTNDTWASTSELINRMNFALALASNRIAGVEVSIDAWPGEGRADATPEQEESWLERVILNGTISGQMHEAVLKTLLDTPAQNQAAVNLVLAGDNGASPFATGLQRYGTHSADTRVAVMAGLLIGSPDFQRR